MASVSQVKRLLDLLARLRSEQNYTVASLADQLGVSRRTLFRDLKSLEKLGVSAQFNEREQRYELKTSGQLAEQAEITPAELQTLLEVSALREGSDVGDAAAAVVKRTGILQWLDSPRHLRFDVATLVNAVETGRRISVAFNGNSLAEVEPLRLLFSRGSWYVLVRPIAQQDARLVPLPELQSVTASGTRFAVPSVDETDRLVRQAWQAKPVQHTAVIRFDPAVANDIVADNADRGGPVQWQEDGLGVASLPVRDESGFVPWILSFGARATVLKPASLRERVVAEMRRSLGNYADTAS